MENKKLIVMTMFYGGFAFTLTTTLLLYFREKVWFERHLNKMISLYEKDERTVIYGKKYFGVPLVLGVFSGLLLWMPAASAYLIAVNTERFLLLLKSNFIGIVIVTAIILNIILQFINYFMSFVLISNKYVYIRGISSLKNIKFWPMSKYKINSIERILVSSVYCGNLLIIKFNDGNKFKFKAITNHLEIVQALDPEKEKTTGNLCSAVPKGTTVVEYRDEIPNQKDAPDRKAVR